MKINDIDDRKQLLRKLGNRNWKIPPFIDPMANNDEQSPYTVDIRGKSFDDGSNKRGRTLKYDDVENKELRDKPSINSKAIGMSEEVLQFSREFFKIAKSIGYDPKVIIDSYGYKLQIETTNGIKMSMAIGKGKNIFKSRMYLHLSQSDNSDLKEKKKELYAALRQRFQLGPEAFTKNGGKYYMDSGTPSLPLEGDVDSRMQTFFKTVPYIENMGNISIYKGRSSSSKELVTRINTPIRYYIGAASMIYIATRFGMRNLLGRDDSEDAGTFDIKREQLTVGITDAGMADYISGKNPYYEHAVPVNVIKKAAIEMAKSDKSKDIFNKDLVLKIALMIKRNLIIVRTGHDESAEMNRSHLDTMPDGWNPINGDPLQRFVDAGIKVWPISGGKRLREDKQ